MEQVRIVLVDPLYSGNVGAICRCMANCGVHDLVIAEGSRDMDTVDCRKRAMHAETIMQNRRECSTLAEAVEDCIAVIGTTARKGLYRAHSKTMREWAPDLVQLAAAGRVALVFGTEDKGLSNDHLLLCTHLVQIPSHPDYSSLNLSHAVMICLYEMYVASGHFEPSEEISPPAPSGQRERLLMVWREMLQDIGFMNEEKSDHMMQGVRRIFTRDNLTLSDVKIMMGVARQSQWNAMKVKELKTQLSSLQAELEAAKSANPDKAADE